MSSRFSPFRRIASCARDAAHAVGLLACLLSPAAAEPAHGVAMHGQPALAAGFAHLPYVNPEAPKGGTVRLGQIGTYDSLNPFIVFGVAAAGIREYVFESLLGRSQDEPFSLYGLIANAVDIPDDRRSVTFHLDPAAKFSDGKPITADDVLFTWALLKEKGQPFMRNHYRTVAKAWSPGPGVVTFIFDDSGNREAPLLLGLMPILPRHLISPEAFDKTSLKAPIGSGPYVVDQIDPGRSLTLKRNPTWWGASKGINRGRFNFDQIRTEYFRDQTTLFEAFKTGDVHVRVEDDAGRWAEGYDFPAVADGRIRRGEIATGLPAGMTGLVLNTRRATFRDQRVRQALIHLLDFEWINGRLFHGHYTRTQSFFARSELASFGRPASEIEARMLTAAGAKVKPDILAGTFAFPRSDGQGHNRENLGAAFSLLKAAGYRQDGGRLVHEATGTPFVFEMMASSRSEERLFQAFAKQLERLGIVAKIRLVDSAQRWARLKSFDFDVIQWTWPASLSPGYEQLNRWGGARADIELSLNYPGVRDSAVDAIIDALVSARGREEFVAAARSLDRTLLSGDYVIPLYHPKALWVAHWVQLQRPATPPLAGLVLDSWWIGQDH